MLFVVFVVLVVLVVLVVRVVLVVLVVLVVRVVRVISLQSLNSIPEMKAMHPRYVCGTSKRSLATAASRSSPTQTLTRLRDLLAVLSQLDQERAPGGCAERRARAAVATLVYCTNHGLSDCRDDARTCSEFLQADGGLAAPDAATVVQELAFMARARRGAT
jgi:hypothetical protein